MLFCLYGTAEGKGFVVSFLYRLSGFIAVKVVSSFGRVKVGFCQCARGPFGRRGRPTTAFSFRPRRCTLCSVRLTAMGACINAFPCIGLFQFVVGDIFFVLQNGLSGTLRLLVQRRSVFRSHTFLPRRRLWRVVFFFRVHSLFSKDVRRSRVQSS